MKHKRIITSSAQILAAACIASAGIVAIAACAAPDPHTAPTESEGTITAALTAVGPDGATYTLPQGAYLNLTNTNSGVNNYLYFNASTATQSFNVGAGTYSATLVGGEDGASWQLGRAADGGATTSAAILNDPQPYAFTIAPGQTTNLVFHFTVLGVGALTFSNGTLTTGLAVDAGIVPPGHITVNGTLVMQSPTASELTATPAVNALLSYTTTPSIAYTENLTITSPFVADVDEVCASVTGTIVATAVGDAGTPGTNISDFFEESSLGTGQVCIHDASDSGYIWIYLVRGGGADTAPFFNALNGTTGQAADGGGVSAYFQVDVNVFPPAPIYNGTTLTFPTVSSTNAVVSPVLQGVGPGGAQVAGQGTTTIQFNP